MLDKYNKLMRKIEAENEPKIRIGTFDDFIDELNGTYIHDYDKNNAEEVYELFRKSYPEKFNNKGEYIQPVEGKEEFIKRFNKKRRTMLWKLRKK